jgi:hypothetical protein
MVGSPVIPLNLALVTGAAGLVSDIAFVPSRISNNVVMK